jgi:hypothetical protein
LAYYIYTAHDTTTGEGLDEALYTSLKMAYGALTYPPHHYAGHPAAYPGGVTGVITKCDKHGETIIATKTLVPTEKS